MRNKLFVSHLDGGFPNFCHDPIHGSGQVGRALVVDEERNDPVQLQDILPHLSLQLRIRGQVRFRLEVLFSDRFLIFKSTA